MGDPDIADETGRGAPSSRRQSRPAPGARDRHRRDRLFRGVRRRARLLHRRAFSGRAECRSRCASRTDQAARLYTTAGRTCAEWRRDFTSTRTAPTTDLIAMTLSGVLRADPGDFPGLCQDRQTHPGEARSLPGESSSTCCELMLPLPNPYPGETISPDAGAIRFADQNDYAKLAVSQAATIGAPVSYAPRGLSRRPYVHCRGAGRNAPLGSLQLATRRWRSEHQSPMRRQ